MEPPAATGLRELGRIGRYPPLVCVSVSGSVRVRVRDWGGGESRQPQSSMAGAHLYGFEPHSVVVWQGWLFPEVEDLVGEKKRVPERALLSPH